MLNGKAAGSTVTVRSVDRALEVLEALGRHARPLSLVEIAGAIEAPKSTTFTILRTLARRGFLETDRSRGTYLLGPRLAALGGAARPSRDLQSIAHPHLDALARTTREAVFLSVAEGHEVVFLEKIDSAQPIRYIAQVGTRRPLHCTASGKLLLAHGPAARVEQYIAEAGLARYTASTIVSARRLRDELEQIRRRGYAISRGEFLADLIGLAVPIHRPGSAEVVAGVLVAGPAFRLRRHTREWIPLLRACAGAISADLAHTPEPMRVPAVGTSAEHHILKGAPR